MHWIVKVPVLRSLMTRCLSSWSKMSCVETLLQHLFIDAFLFLFWEVIKCDKCTPKCHIIVIGVNSDKTDERISATSSQNHFTATEESNDGLKSVTVIFLVACFIVERRYANERMCHSFARCKFVSNLMFVCDNVDPFKDFAPLRNPRSPQLPGGGRQSGLHEVDGWSHSRRLMHGFKTDLQTERSRTRSRDGERAFVCTLSHAMQAFRFIDLYCLVALTFSL